MTQKKSIVLLLAAFLSAACESSGACITHDLDSGGWWCNEDEEEEYCNAEWAAEFPIGNDYVFEEEKLCAQVGYANWCDQQDMEASGSSAVYLEGRYLSNASCDPLVPAGGSSGGGGSCDTFNDMTTYFGDTQFDSFCWQAGILRACGQSGNADTTCNTLQEFLNSSGGGSAGKCPYC